MKIERSKIDWGLVRKLMRAARQRRAIAATGAAPPAQGDVIMSDGDVQQTLYMFGRPLPFVWNADEEAWVLSTFRLSGFFSVEGKCVQRRERWEATMRLIGGESERTLDGSEHYIEVTGASKEQPSLAIEEAATALRDKITNASAAIEALAKQPGNASYQAPRVRKDVMEIDQDEIPCADKD